ncbi:MAG: hypothetical protein KF764_24310 [Labilithrix sp.]|nr:hypothetical protein [Labilithrix sp.]MBX3221735.1 hypothetical protein [Labilithrix sp.]
MLRRRWVLAGLVVGVACTPFSSVPSGDGDGDADAATVEPGQVDGGADPSDAAAIPDASLDGRVTPCTARHVICQDFDDPLPFAGWQVVRHADTTLVVDDSLWTSPPASLRIASTGVQAGNRPSFISKTVPPATHFVVSADVDAAVIGGTNGDLDILALELTPTAGFERYFAAIVIKGEGTFVLESETKQTSAPAVRRDTPLGPLAAGFVRVTLDLDLATGDLFGRVDTGATVTQRLPKTPAMTGSFRVGAPYVDNTTGRYFVHLDNVVLD